MNADRKSSQYEYTLTELKIELHSRLRQDTIMNVPCLKP